MDNLHNDCEGWGEEKQGKQGKFNWNWINESMSEEFIQWSGLWLGLHICVNVNVKDELWEGGGNPNGSIKVITNG